jgi:hypothetical protein
MIFGVVGTTGIVAPAFARFLLAAMIRRQVLFSLYGVRRLSHEDREPSTQAEPRAAVNSH